MSSPTPLLRRRLDGAAAAGDYPAPATFSLHDSYTIGRVGCANDGIGCFDQQPTTGTIDQVEFYDFVMSAGDVGVKNAAESGIGEWTVQMFLIFRLGRLDVMPTGDLGVQEGMRILDGLRSRPKPKELGARAEVWRPLRSVATWTLYRLTDTAAPS